MLSSLSEEESKTLTAQGMRKGVTSVPELHAKLRKVVKETMESQEEGSGWRRENLTKTAKALKELEDITNLGLTLRMKKEIDGCIKLLDKVSSWSH